ncbi:MAG: hypothetical protein IKQ82_03315 [Lentisphaeria bacterium]|nr:hypothetical protein [Lentisphaeria bacterium]
MNLKHLFAAALCAVLTVGAYAADKLAIAEPVGKGGVPAADIEAFWGILESSVQSDEYTLISRGALKQMMTEIGLTTSSDLVNLNSNQKARLGEVEGVKYILVSEIGKFGTRLNCTMRILDASTGEIDQARTANLRVADLDQLADQIESTLQTMLSDDKNLKTSALLTPIIKVSAPAYLAEDFNVRLESSLMEKGLRLQNLQSVAKILKKNDLDNLNELEPKMYVKVGKLLEVEMLIQATITRFEIEKIAFNVAETGAKGFRYIGHLEGSVRIVSARTGETLASVPFEERVNFRDLPISMTRDWTVDDYGKYLIKTIIPAEIIPALVNSPALKEKLPATASAKESEAKESEAKEPEAKEESAGKGASAGIARRLLDGLRRTTPEQKD